MDIKGDSKLSNKIDFMFIMYTWMKVFYQQNLDIIYLTLITIHIILLHKKNNMY